MKTRRISIRLSQSEFENLEYQARKRGIFKSDLVRNAISSTNVPTKIVRGRGPQSKTKTFNLFLDPESLSRLNRLSRSLSCSKTEVIQCLIAAYVNPFLGVSQHENKLPNKYLATSISTIWRKGELEKLFKLNDIEIGNLSIEDFLTYSLCWSEVGNFKYVKYILDVYREYQSFSGRDKIYFKGIELLLKLNITSRLNQFHGLEHGIQELYELGKGINDNFLMGFAELLFVQYYYELEDFETTLIYNSRAFENIDRTMYPIIYGHLLTYQVSTLAKLVKFDQIGQYVRELKDMIDETNNRLLQTLLESELEMLSITSQLNNNLLSGQVSPSLFAKESGSQLYALYKYQAKAIAKFTMNPNSIGGLEAVLKLERENWPEKEFSYTQLFKTLFLARKDYAFADKLIQRNEHSKRSPIRPELQSYIISSSKFLYSTCDEQRASARKQLVKLQDSGSYKQITDASKATLNEKRLCLIW